MYTVRGITAFASSLGLLDFARRTGDIFTTATARLGGLVSSGVACPVAGSGCRY